MGLTRVLGYLRGFMPTKPMSADKNSHAAWGTGTTLAGVETSGMQQKLLKMIELTDKPLALSMMSPAEKVNACAAYRDKAASGV